MTALRRTEAAGYGLTDCITPDVCRDLAESGELSARILPIETAFSVYPKVPVTAAQAVRFQNGGELSVDRVSALPDTAEIVRIYNPEQVFLGLGKVNAESIRVLRIFV